MLDWLKTRRKNPKHFSIATHIQPFISFAFSSSLDFVFPKPSILIPSAVLLPNTRWQQQIAPTKNWLFHYMILLTYLWWRFKTSYPNSCNLHHMYDHGYHLFQKYSWQFRDFIVNVWPFIIDLLNDRMLFKKQEEKHAVLKFEKKLSYFHVVMNIFFLICHYESHSLGATTLKQTVWYKM